MSICTIYENIFSKQPHYIPVVDALSRIKNGKSKEKIEEIRSALDKEKADALKRQLPSVCFSGKFTPERKDEKIIEHSGFLVLDFDEVEDVGEMAATLAGHDFVFAVWLSPRGNGVKALVRLADGKKHRQHFDALREIFPNADRSGVNESRVCYESYDPNLYLNVNAVPFTKTLEQTKFQATEAVGDEAVIFKNLLKWLTGKGDAFVKGERNTFIFKLASACCRYGIYEENTASLMLSEYPASSDFTQKECVKAIQSAYRAGKHTFGTAQFERNVFVDKTTRKEVKVDEAIYNPEVQPKDVVYGSMVKAAAMNIYYDGYKSADGLGIPLLDKHFKSKRGEITCLTGIGNYGKSTLYKWYTMMRVLKFGEKFAAFAPEDNPPEEYYHDFVEMLLGCECTPYNPLRPADVVYSEVYDYVSRNIFYIYPKDLSPTPEYVKERFLELAIKEKIDGVAIDPFNQMAHNYSGAGGRSDKYLETVLGDFSRFAQANSLYFTIIAHPVKMQKAADGNYPCPDVFDLADGAMWNNKMDNIIVYHKATGQTDPNNRACEFHSKKIRRQKMVGVKGFFEMDYNRTTRRFEIEGVDHMARLLKEKNVQF